MALMFATSFATTWNVGVVKGSGVFSGLHITGCNL